MSDDEFEKPSRARKFFAKQANQADQTNQSNQSNQSNRKKINSPATPLRKSNNRGGLFRWLNSSSPVQDAPVQDAPLQEPRVKKRSRDSTYEVIDLTDDKVTKIKKEVKEERVEDMPIPELQSGVEEFEILEHQSGNDLLAEIQEASRECTMKQISLLKNKYNDISRPDGMPPIIGGIGVHFPVSPYKSQISVINTVIKGCKNKANCLIESPTGSGKTLALLCAALAWQQQEKVKRMEALIETADSDKSSPGTSEDSKTFQDKPKKSGQQEVMPKIFYGARTHKQIEQVIREFRKTAYRDVPMTILSSREHTCIQTDTGNVGKTQLCNSLLDPKSKKGCPYKEKGKGSGVWAQLDTPWDIEDLVQFGVQHRSCPYFAARNMMDEADLIFCPYNYLMDPVIRDSMKINLKGHIVIVDEAHNMENICRDIGSMDFREDHLYEAAEECHAVASITKNDIYNRLQSYLESVLCFIQKENIPKLLTPQSWSVSSEVMTGQKAWMQLSHEYKLDGERFKLFKSACQEAFKAYNELKEDIREPLENNGKVAKPKKKELTAIGFATKRLLEELLMSLEALQHTKYQDDFRVATSMKFHFDARIRVKENTWVAAKENMKLRTLQTMCMNPGMVFSQVASEARSVVLASGTLTPTGTFESELETKFDHLLHANHVISKDQLYARVISKGPSGKQLTFTYNEVQNLNLKDEFGRLALDICKLVPHGVLCFFPSYKTMNTIIERWKMSGLWNELERYKQIFLEPNRSSDLDRVMSDYRDVISETNNGPNACGQTGALMLGVYRGKISEGIDFSDNEARCVIATGIPFPNAHDMQIDTKRKYNNLHTDRGLVHGNTWYSIQAWRAFNQALGRCIRHQKDWGIILMVDSRLLGTEKRDNLPKWIQDQIQQPATYDQIQEEIEDFVANRKRASEK